MGIFDSFKKQAGDIGDKVKDQVGDMTGKAKNQMAGGGEGGDDKARDMTDEAGDMAGNTAGRAGDMAGHAGDTINDATGGRMDQGVNIAQQHLGDEDEAARAETDQR